MDSCLKSLIKPSSLSFQRKRERVILANSGLLACDVCYKLISKIIVNRLRPLLSKMVDPIQVAFVPNRWLTENVALAQELVHNFEKTGKKKGFLGVKLDFQKAYDHLE